MTDINLLHAPAYLNPAMEEKIKADMNFAKGAFIACIRNYCPEFTINEENRDTVNRIFHWCLRNTNGTYDPRKGLWIYGGVGTGKTTMMRGILSFIAKHWLRDSGEKVWTSWKDAPTVCDSYAVSGLQVLTTPPTGIDEIGSEFAPTNHNGNKLNVIAYLVESLANRKEAIPHIVTTNLSFSEVYSTYGARVVDRIGALFNLVPMNWYSWRHDSDAIWEMIKAEEL